MSRFVISFLLRSQCLLTSWHQLPSTVILEPRKIKSVTSSIFSSSPSINRFLTSSSFCHQSDGRLVAKSCLTFCNFVDYSPKTIVHQAPLSIGFPRKEYWSGLPFPSPGIFLTQGLNPRLLHWQVDSLPLTHQGCPLNKLVFPNFKYAKNNMMSKNNIN